MILRTAALLAIAAATIAAGKPLTPQVAAAKDLRTSLQVAAQATTGQSLYTLPLQSASDKNRDERLELKSGGNDHDGDPDKDRDKECKNKHRPSDSHDCRPSVSPD